MNLKNYTSRTPALTTISWMEACLSQHNVTGIAKTFKNGIPDSLMFQMTVNGRQHTVRIVAKVAEVQEFFWREYCATHSHPRKTKEDFAEQASMTAWKIQYDWLVVQLSLIKLKQVEFLQAFMAFVWDGSQTYFDYLKGSNFKALPQSTG